MRAQHRVLVVNTFDFASTLFFRLELTHILFECIWYILGCILRKLSKNETVLISCHHGGLQLRRGTCCGSTNGSAASGSAQTSGCSQTHGGHQTNGCWVARRMLNKQHITIITIRFGEKCTKGSCHVVPWHPQWRDIGRLWPYSLFLRFEVKKIGSQVTKCAWSPTPVTQKWCVPFVVACDPIRARSIIFEGSLAEKLRFWVSQLHFWRKSRRKASF